MSNKKITAFVSSASAQASTIYPVVSGGDANKIITQHTMLQSLGIPQYVEGTCRATATVAFLPGPVNIFDIYVKVLAGSSAQDGGSDIDVGIGTDRFFYASPVSTSGARLYRADAAAFTSAPRLSRASGAVVAAAPTASAGANFVVGIGYFRV